MIFLLTKKNKSEFIRDKIMGVIYIEDRRT